MSTTFLEGIQMIAKRLLAATAFCIALQGASIYTYAGKPTRNDTSRTAWTPTQGNLPNATKNSGRLAAAKDLRLHLIDPRADLEVNAAIVADYHDLGFWYNHRIEIEIRNVDVNHSGPLRTFEVGTVSFNPGGGTMLYEGFIPSLAPGETDKFSLPVLSHELFDSGLFYVRLSPDKETGNDLSLFTFAY